ncbi:MAG TPA: universal stress protein [Opitutae bacterium]|nr:universal stress protein [Opitutae bacterium]|tara:strand:+ start:3391 stop:4245 length:855 start_codon:yes stop_codon:yes gene_type:complete
MKKVLICTDGSPYSEECCQFAAWLAKRVDVHLHAVYVSDLRQFELSVVADLSGSMGIQPYQGMLTQIQDMEDQKAKLLKAGTLDFFNKQGLEDRVTFAHYKGLLVDRVLDLEREDPEIGMVMLGKRGENANFATEHLGSTMERVVRASEKPCLVTSRKFREIKKIAFAYDGSPSCQKALKFLSTSPLFEGLDVHLVTVDEGRNEEEASERLSEASSQLQASGLKLVTQVLTGIAENVIGEYVESEDIDLLVMGAYGHSRIRYLIIGSTTTDLIRRCHIPILLFR